MKSGKHPWVEDLVSGNQSSGNPQAVASLLKTAKEVSDGLLIEQILKKYLEGSN